MEGRKSFLTPQGDPSEAFDTIEETLDQMALLVEHPVDGLRVGPARILLDLRRGSEIIRDEPAEMIGVIGGIGHHMPDALQTVDQAARLRTIAPLTGRDCEADRQAKRVNAGVDLGGQAALGATDCVSFSPPFAPLASA